MEVPAPAELPLACTVTPDDGPACMPGQDYVILHVTANPNTPDDITPIAGLFRAS